MNIAIILAGGVGSRAGTDIPKQFVKVLGKPVMAYTLEKFQGNKNIEAIEIVCINSNMNYVKEIVETYGITKVRWFVDGGDTFQKSTMNGIFYLKGKIQPSDNVIIHFAVSPMVTDEVIDDAIRICNIYGNAISADEMVLCTCIKKDEYCSSQSILRETIVGLNAPWAFKYRIVCSAYETAIENDMLKELEPHTTSLMFALGKTIYFSKSVTNNIKITRREDFDMFEGYLLLQQKRIQENDI